MDLMDCYLRSTFWACRFCNTRYREDGFLQVGNDELISMSLWLRDGRSPSPWVMVEHRECIGSTGIPRGHRCLCWGRLRSSRDVLANEVVPDECRQDHSSAGEPSRPCSPDGH